MSRIPNETSSVERQLGPSCSPPSASIVPLARCGSGTRRLPNASSAARADCALVAERWTRVADGFYDVGLALGRLSDPQALRANGVSTFAELCRREFDIPLCKAQALVHMAGAMHREGIIQLAQAGAGRLMSMICSGFAGRVARRSEPDARLLEARLESRLRSEGLPNATVRAFVEPSGGGVELRIRGVPMLQLDRLCHTLGADAGHRARGDG